MLKSTLNRRLDLVNAASIARAAFVLLLVQACGDDPWCREIPPGPATTDSYWIAVCPDTDDGLRQDPYCSDPEFRCFGGQVVRANADFREPRCSGPRMRQVTCADGARAVCYAIPQCPAIR